MGKNKIGQCISSTTRCRKCPLTINPDCWILPLPCLWGLRVVSLDWACCLDNNVEHFFSSCQIYFWFGPLQRMGSFQLPHWHTKTEEKHTYATFGSGPKGCKVNYMIMFTHINEHAITKKPKEPGSEPL